MPRIPLAVVSTSSDDSGDSEGDLAGDFRTADWTVVHMASIESFPFSEVSHQPYGMDSTFLDSVSHGSAHLRMRNSGSNAQDMVALSPRVSPRSPRSLLPRGTSNYHQLTPTSMNSTHPRGANAALLGLGASGAGRATLSPIGRGIPGAPPLPHRNRKAKPKSRRTRSLQVGAPRWRDSDGDMELLVRREVSKNGPVSPVATEDYAVLSIETSSAGTSPATTPPPLWVESPSKKDGVEKENGRQKNGEALIPTAPAALPQARVLEATTAATAGGCAGAPSPQRRASQLTDSAGKKKAAHATTAARMPLSGRRLSSPVVRGNNSSNSNSNSSTTAATTKPATDARRQSLTHSDTTSNSTKVTQKHAGAPSDAFASSPPAASAASAQVGAAPPVAVSRVATAAPPGPLKGKGIAGGTTGHSATKVFPKAAENGDRRGRGETAAARSPLTHRVQPLKDTAAPAAAAVVLLPPVSPSSATTATTTTAATTTAAAGERPPSAKPEERRRRPRRFSLQSSNTVDTTASSVESVIVKPQGRHPTLKPLVTSPDDTDPVLPSRATATQSPDVALSNSLPALSPKQLSSRAGDSESTPRRRLKRAQTMTPSVEVSPKRGAAQAEADVALAGSLNTFSTLLPPDSPPTLRPQTREFNEKAASPTGGGGAAAPSFVSPASRATAERLVTFVRAVSDPEVLHVIYDYLTEQQRSTPRFRLAATACAELLERKEELLKTQEEATPAGSEGHGVRNSPGQQQHYPPPQDSDCFTLDVGQTTAVMGETSRAAEVRRLLSEIAAEQAVTEGAAAAAEQDGDDGREEDPDVDEFDDFNYFDAPYPPQGHFSFGQPTVSGVVSRVFAEGMLFKIKTMDGNYHFYNDTLQDVMMVRVQCVLRGNETINERAMLAPVEESKETEITIAVLPEETNFFMSGVSHLPHFMAKRVPVPPDYASPSVTQSLRKINAEINAVRKALGKWSRASDQAAFLKCCLRHHLKFTDLTFRPCTESLYRRGCDAVTIPAVTWRRPEEYVYLPEVAQTRLFRGEISCFLVRQGELSNHTVVAAMAAIAQFPSHVRWLFRHPVSAAVGKMERAEGCYRVTLLHNGWWKTYVMDDYVPASLKGPLFASCPEDPRRLWVPLLEKAYAKSLGAYAATCVVDAMEAMGDFTGFPVRYLDTLWAAAKAKPTGPPCRTLFQYIQRAVRAGCTVLLFTPAASDAASKNTVTLSKLRSSRLLPVKGVTPQFLPGHIYFLNDVAYYEELDLRMAQLKNPWTWETRHRMHREKKWKYTTWYDRPDISMSAMGSALGSSGALSTGTANRRPVATNLGSSVGMTQAAQQLNERKGTMWVEWREVLAAFAGGGVCYTLWSYHRYRAKNAFVNGRPRFVLEMKARRKVEVFVTLSLETVSETLDSYGTVVASRPLPLCGTAMAVVRRLSRQSAHVVSESCEDVECVAGRRTYVVAKDVSTKLTIDPRVAEGTVLVVPLLDPQAAEDMTLGSSTTGGGTAAEVRFVLSLVTEAVAGDGEDLSISFVSMRRSCGVFTDSAAPFDLESTSRVTASYQICTERGVKTLEGNRICDAEAGSPPPS